MKWIAVNQQLPPPVTNERGSPCDNSEWVYVVVEDADGKRWADVSFYTYPSARWVHENSKLAGISVDLKVTHWMTIPPFPEN